MPANATVASDVNTSETIAAAIQSVAPREKNAPTRATENQSTYLANSMGNRVSIPKDATHKVKIQSLETSSVAKNGSNTQADLSVTMPRVPGLQSARLAADGTVAFPSIGSTSLAVQPMIDASRMLSVLHSKTAPTQFIYTFDHRHGVELEVLNTGAVLISSSNGSIIAAVAPPWAFDALGTPVKTWYQVNGDTLVQYVEHTSSSFTYPIVADPRITTGCGLFLNLTGGEIKGIAVAFLALPTGGLIGACSKTLPMPAQDRAILSIACTAGGGAALKSLYDAISKVNSSSLNSAACYQTKILSFWGDKNPKLTQVNSKGNCTP